MADRPRLEIRPTPADLALLEALCADTGLDRSAVVRLALRELAKRRKVTAG